jgi:hypothetical protein
MFVECKEHDGCRRQAALPPKAGAATVRSPLSFTSFSSSPFVPVHLINFKFCSQFPANTDIWNKVPVDTIQELKDDETARKNLVNSIAATFKHDESFINLGSALVSEKDSNHHRPKADSSNKNSKKRRRDDSSDSDDTGSSSDDRRREESGDDDSGSSSDSMSNSSDSGDDDDGTCF